MPDTPLLLTAAAIRDRVRAMAATLDRHCPQSGPTHLIGVLKGALMFLADLARAMETPVTIDVMTVSRYDGDRASTRGPRLVHDLQTSIEGRDVVLVEDIVDTGRTLHFLQDRLRAGSPRRLRSVALLDKPARRIVDVAVDDVGFTIPDRFVVGYGLDYREGYRHLPYITEMPVPEREVSV